MIKTHLPLLEAMTPPGLTEKSAGPVAMLPRPCDSSYDCGMVTLTLLFWTLVAQAPVATSGDELDQLTRAADQEVTKVFASGGDLAQFVTEHRALAREVFESRLRNWLLGATADQSAAQRLAEQFESSFEDSSLVERLEHLTSLSKDELDRWRRADQRVRDLRQLGGRPDPVVLRARTRASADEFAALGDAFRHAEALYVAGKALSESGQSPAAIELLDEALPIAERDHAEVLQAQLENRLCRSLVAAGAIQRATRVVAVYQAHVEALGTRQHVGLALNLRSMIARREGRLEEAQQLQDQALRIFEEIHDAWYQCATLINIARCYLATHEYAKTLERCAALRQLAQAHHYREPEARAAMLMASARTEATEGYDGRADFAEALKLARGCRDQETEVAALFGYAQACDVHHDLEQALDLYNQGESLARSIGAFEGEVFGCRKGVALVKLGKVEEGLECIDRAAARFREAGYLDQLVAAATLRTEALTHLARFEEALKSAEEAVLVLEQVRRPIQSEETRFAYTEGYWYVFPDGFRAAAKAYERSHDHSYLERGVDLLEKGRARVLFEMMTPSGGDPSQLKTASLNAIQRSLRDDEALLLYTATPTEACLAVVTSATVQPVQLGAWPLIRDHALALREALRHRGDCRPLARELYQRVLAPALDCLGGVKHLIVSPHDALWFVPFEVLVDSDAKDASAFLLRQYSVSYVHSGSLLVELRQQRAQPSRRLLALGDPICASQPRLPWSGNEVQAIGAIRGLDASQPRLPWSGNEVQAIGAIRGLDATVLVREAATEDVLKSPELSSYRYLHLACHGLVNEQDPAQSQLILSPGAVEDGRVTWDEVMKLKLDADLVVLSACRLQSGPVTRTEGLMGFSRAWLQAGARSLVLALWDVEDASSAELMRAFWTNLVQDGCSAAEALRLAKLALIDRATHAAPGVVLEESYADAPYFWAPWVLIGG
jgi:CHAT domain-containing protein